jgi:hypothetical protein
VHDSGKSLSQMRQVVQHGQQDSLVASLQVVSLEEVDTIFHILVPDEMVFFHRSSTILVHVSE